LKTKSPRIAPQYIFDISSTCFKDLHRKFVSINDQMDPMMSKSEGAAVAYVAPLKPALAAIPGAIDYLGGPSRSKFYADLLPHLDIVRFGKRTFVTIESLDRLIAGNLQPAAKGYGRWREVAEGLDPGEHRPALGAGK
jgi:hypothetical protein